MQDPLIQIKNLNFFYQKNCALSNINLSVNSGDFLAILGPNGGGKTTLLKIMLGLLSPSSGEISILGKSSKAALGEVGYVPQLSALDNCFPITVEDVVKMGLKKKTFSLNFSSKEKKRVLEVMEQTNTLHLAKKRIGALSGGERQRVLLSRALIAEPELLIFDEPTANIDPFGTACFFDLFNSLAKDKTLIVVTHDLGITAANINSIACLNQTLLYHDKPTLSPEMLPFLYGSAHPNCTAEEALNTLMNSFNLNKKTKE